MVRLGRGYPAMRLVASEHPGLSVAYHSTGVGGTTAQTSGTTSNTTSYACGAAIGDTVMITVAIECVDYPAGTTGTMSSLVTTLGGATLTPLLTVWCPTLTNAIGQALYGVTSVSAANQTIQSTCNASASSFVAVQVGNVNYQSPGAISLGATLSNTGTSTSPSHTVSGAPGGSIIYQSFTANNNAGTSAYNITGYNQTQRFHYFSAADSMPITIGDAAGKATVNFTAAISTSTQWCSGAVILNHS